METQFQRFKTVLTPTDYAKKYNQTDMSVLIEAILLQEIVINKDSYQEATVKKRIMMWNKKLSQHVVE